MRNMSFALTSNQILDKSKTVTRRMGWLTLKAGDLIQPVEKCMGLKPGEKVKRLGSPIRITNVTRQHLWFMDDEPHGTYGIEECRKEGFPSMKPSEFVEMFCKTHKGCKVTTVITRIEFEYTDLLKAENG